jgi:peroxiredoxin
VLKVQDRSEQTKGKVMRPAVLLLLGIGCVVIGGGIFGKYCLDHYEPSEYTGPVLPPPAHVARVGDAIAPIKLRDLQGNPVTLGGARSRPLLVHYWASWCLPCVQELQFYASAKTMLDAKGIDLVTIAQDDIDHAEEIVERQHLTLPVWVSDDAQFDPLLAIGSGMGNVPFNALLDANGKVIAQKLGVIAGGSDGLLAWVNQSVRNEQELSAVAQ